MGEQLAAVRSGDWKLHITPQGKPNALFNLKSDIGKKQNVLNENPEVTKRLHGYLKEFANDIKTDNGPAAYVKNPKPLSK